MYVYMCGQNLYRCLRADLTMTPPIEWPMNDRRYLWELKRLFKKSVTSAASRHPRVSMLRLVRP